MNNTHNDFDVIVIGGGHAGIEASYASARMKVKTLLVTQDIDTIGQMSCNPSIGGISKGHLVKEIDALGGIMAYAADKSGIQFRILNSSKGAAVQSTRAQIDRFLYHDIVLRTLLNTNNLTILPCIVDNLIIENNYVKGIITNFGEKIRSRTVILAVGTFLNGIIHIGLNNFSGGRIHEPSFNVLANFLNKKGFKINRLKTGTPPRLNKNSINFSNLNKQDSDNPLPVFSFLGSIKEHPMQKPCFITNTNEKTHEIISNNFNQSPLFTGGIKGIGPRYCPSIEDKIKKFEYRKSHQIFLEPEGLSSNIIYPNGISTSLPLNVQINFINSIHGLEKTTIAQPGYAIEYDFLDPRDLDHSLESKIVHNLFLAGQINGSTGYEEAAAQGIIAGINAALRIKNKDAWYPKRNEAYIGVMIDDLTIKGVNDPYRMFTSRAEYRLLLREDNADIRLTSIGYKLGCVDEIRYKSFMQKLEDIEYEKNRLSSILIVPNTKSTNKLQSMIQRNIEGETTAINLLRCQDINYLKLVESNCILENKVISMDVIKQIEIQMRYQGYINKQQIEIDRYHRYENMIIPNNIDYNSFKSLSKEVLEKLNKYRPKTLGEASRISGITPAAVLIILVHLRKT